MARKKHDAHGGGHGWFVTFADLMGLLMAFFVVLVAFSSQDKKKMAIVAGSMREAFGSQKQIIADGVIDISGSPARTELLNNTARTPDETSDLAGPLSPDRRDTEPAARGFARAAATLRQALRSMPEIADVSSQIVVEDTSDGVSIAIVDQDGRSMFTAGSSAPSQRVIDALAALAPSLRALNYPISITGHTAAGVSEGANTDPWRLSAERASAVRGLLAAGGVPDSRFATVQGKAATEPMFPDAPQIAANRRVTIALTAAPGAIPMDLKP
ncbi:flagellar motor protein MotB [Hansschlegelia sp.]|uniref:OmpA/MotB family protein n=1 Tax=Hansschlegelia sp. TaxID=2041892 RepID=UPI002C7F8082|nr:flagellar motor protein MotB [Hansschlegelia sp.]HVI27823.1 flagellar motor protein MotB [Hansschlegelia sp.]